MTKVIQGGYDFPLKSRPYGDGIVQMAMIKCMKCHREEWKPAKKGGWAIRIFQNEGWLVGSRRTTDVCPGCRKQRPSRNLSPAGKRRAYVEIEKRHIAQQDGVAPPERVLEVPPLNPAIPADLGKQIKENIVRQHLVNSVASAPLASAPLVKDATINPDIPVHRGNQQLGPSSALRRSTQAVRHHAVAVLTREGITKPTNGVDYYVLPKDGGWFWKPAADVTPADVELWKATRKVTTPYGTKKARNLGAQLPKEDTPMATQAETTTAPLPAPAYVEPRPITRDERHSIHETLTRHYNTALHRYDADWSDLRVAENLNVPRAHVTQVRLDFFGDHDRNEVGAVKRMKIDQAIVMASDATKRLLEMATEAEALEKSLRQARDLLG